MGKIGNIRAIENRRNTLRQGMTVRQYRHYLKKIENGYSPEVARESVMRAKNSDN